MTADDGSSKDFDEIEEDGNIEECTSQKPTVKNLMEDELGKVKLLKKNPNDEIQRRLVDLGNDVSLGRSSEHTNKSIDRSYHQAGISTPSIPPMDSGVLNYAEEYDLESVLMNFLGEIYSCHDECPHSDCKNKNELCPSLKSLIHKKVNELNNLPRNIGCAQSQEGNDAKLSDQNNLSNTMAARSKQFKDALEILGSNNELFMKLLQKPNQHIVDSIQKHENSKVAAGLEPNKIHGQTNFLVGRGGSRQHPLATKEQAKERKYMFFWRKGKSNRRQMLEATDTDQTVTKIVILKPNPERGFNQKAATARTLHQQPCTSHAPECGGIDNSKFSIKEVKTRFRFVNSESRRESNLAPAEDLQGYPRKFKDSFVAINKDFRHFPEGSLANKSGSDIKNAIKPFISSKQNGSISGNSGHIVAPKGASIFYEEARRHLSEMLKDNDCSVNYPAVQISKSLEGILSLPHGNVSTPRSSLWGKDYLGPSPGETDVFVACEVQREECTQERSQSQEDFGSIARCTSAAVDDQVTVRDGYYTNEAQEGSRHAQNEPGLLYTEGIHKFICGKNICDEQSVPAEQSRHDVCQEILEEIKQGKEHIKILHKQERIPCLYVYGYIQHSLPITLEQIIKRDLEMWEFFVWMKFQTKLGNQRKAMEARFLKLRLMSHEPKRWLDIWMFSRVVEEYGGQQINDATNPIILVWFTMGIFVLINGLLSDATNITIIDEYMKAHGSETLLSDAAKELPYGRFRDVLEHVISVKNQQGIRQINGVICMHKILAGPAPDSRQTWAKKHSERVQKYYIITPARLQN
ncbi:hypothetical protein ACJX0J_038038 [Zea mays]